MTPARAVGLLVALSWTTPCCRCGDDALAELTARTGSVHRGRAQDATRWGGAAVGDRFGLGDAVRTGGRSTATLRLLAGGVLRLAERTVVRFLPGRPGGGSMGIGIDTGIAEIESTGDGLTLDTELGTARIEGRGRVRLHGGAGERPRLEVLVGTARIEREDGTVELRAGQSVGAEPAVEPDASRPPAPPAPPPAPERPDAGSAAADEPSGGEDAGAATRRRPPRNVVDADGRRYSVLYQTLLPTLTLRWPGTTAPGPYVVTVQPTQGPPRVRMATLPKHTFASGDLGEGSYRFWFRAADGTRSRESTLRISRGQRVH